MKLIALTIATASTLSATFATAQSLPDNMFFDGYIEMSSTDIVGIRDTLGRASLNFGLKPNRDAGLGIGFSIGVDAVDFGIFPIREAALYPAVTFALGNTGLLSVGVPRPVLDYGYIPQDTLAHSASIEAFTEYLGLTNTISSRFYLFGPVVIGQRANFYGVRYDGEFGNTKIGAAYHRMSFSSTPRVADIYSIAFQHSMGKIGRLGEVKLFGGTEAFSDGISKNTTYIFGAEANSDKLRTGLILSKMDGLIDATTANLYADYKFSDRFSLAGSILHVDLSSGGAISNAYGVGVEYQFLNGGYLNANYTSHEFSASGETFEVSLGWRF